MPLDRKAAQRAVEQALAEGKKLAGADVQVTCTGLRAANTRFARGDITSTGDSDDSILDVSVGYGKRHASVSTNQLDPASMRAAVGRAASLARIAPEDPERLPLLGPQTDPHAASRWDAATAGLEAIARARAAGQMLDAAAAKNVQLAGFYEHEARMSVLGNSAGLRASDEATSASLSCTARTTDGTGSGWAGLDSHRASELDAGKLARAAIDKGLRSQSPKRLEPGRYTVVLEAGAVAELMQFMIGAFAARLADEGRSFFARRGGGNRIGDKLFHESVTITTDPADPLAPAVPHDGEGMPVKATTWIDKGVLASLHHSRYWAQKQGKTANGFPSLYHLRGGQAASVEELVRGVDRGVLVTHFFYIRMVDPQTLLTTGLTRDGVFLVEKGEIVGPVNNFRFNESPAVMLANLEAMTRDTWRTPASNALRVPALRTAGFNLASISDAI